MFTLTTGTTDDVISLPSWQRVFYMFIDCRFHM